MLSILRNMYILDKVELYFLKICSARMFDRKISYKNYIYRYTIGRYILNFKEKTLH